MGSETVRTAARLRELLEYIYERAVREGCTASACARLYWLSQRVLQELRRRDDMAW